MRRIIFLIAFLILSKFSFGQNPKLILFKVSIDSIVNYGPIKAYETIDDTVGALYYRRYVSFTFQIENKSKRKLLIPAQLLVGTDFWNDIIFSAERWVDSLKQFRAVGKDIVLPAITQIKHKELNWGDKIIEKGEFAYSTPMNEINRVRFTFLLSKNNKGYKDITTDWIIIRPQQAQHPYSYPHAK